MATTKQKAHIQIMLNGEAIEVAFAPHKTLLEVLREDLALTGTKHGCELGECGEFLGALGRAVADHPVRLGHIHGPSAGVTSAPTRSTIRR